MDRRVAEPNVHFIRHVAKDKTINFLALAIERAFSAVDDDRLGDLTSLFPRARATAVHVSRRADDGLFITGNLLGRRRTVSVVGYDTSLSMRCIEEHRFLQFEIIEAAGVDSLQSRILSAQPILCRGVGIGAILVGSSTPLDALEQESLADLSEALAGVLDDMVLSESMRQLLSWREQDMSFCGPPLELQDVPCLPMASSLRPLVDLIPAALGEPVEEMSEEESAGTREEMPQYSKSVPHDASEKLRGTYEEASPSELPDKIIIRVFGLSWLYLSAVIAGKMFGDGLSLAPSLVAILALVSGLGSCVVLFPGMRDGNMKKMKGVKDYYSY